ncbi:MAG: serine/threonine-protein kinase, partial [Acidobacteriota bacterium]
RDFKPDNVLVGGDGRVRVTDFGLARSVIAPDEGARAKPETSPLHAELTATGTVLGTPRYMPPEQLTGPDIDARSDQFSFCVALYEALYATHPLPGATSVTMLEKGEDALPPPEGTRVPAAIGRAVMRGLARDRSKRFPVMAALMSELVPPPQRSPVRYLSFAAIAVVIVGGATAAVMTRPDVPVQQPPDITEIKPLMQELAQLRAERDRLESELKHMIAERQTTQQELQDVKQQLVELNDQYNKTLEDLTRVRAREAAAKRGPPPVSNVDLRNALASAQHPLEGCFDEWWTRPQDPTEKLPKPHDAQLLVRLSVTPDGIGHDAAATGEVDVQRDGSLTATHGVLSDCVEGAISRVEYPKSAEALDLEVQVAWTAPGQVNASGRVVGRHEAAARQLDLQ